MNWKVPLADVNFDSQEQKAVQEVIQSGWLSMGPVTKKFEHEFAEFLKVRHALAVTNATAALHIALLAVGVGPGDEVIVPSLTFVATVNAIRYTGAVPVFADIESLDWLTISPDSIKDRITDRTRAIMVMHYAGFPCDMLAIQNIAQSNNLVLIEDAAHAIGSNLNGRDLGTFGSFGCYSFFANKNMTTAEGGMLVTDDDALAERSSLLRSHGMTSLSWDRHQGHASSYDVIDLGYNYRIDEIRSALGLIQLDKLPAGNEHRRELTALYRELLVNQAPSIQIPFTMDRGFSCCHLFPILLPAGCDRNQFMSSLRDKGIQSSNHYPPVHLFSIYREKWQAQDHPLPLTEEAANRQVTLPLFSTMREEQVSLVVETVISALQEQGVQ
jgi:dTDP-4-amino-4,6-dideoxygalactose transaminase